MLKINYLDKFDKNRYFKTISDKYFHIAKHELLQEVFCRVGVSHQIEQNGGILPPYEKTTITIQELFDYLKSHKIADFDTLFDGITLEDIIIGDIDTLQKIKNTIGLKKENKYIDFLFNYTNLQSKKIKPFFENNLHIATCYYCNIDYINTYNTRSGKKNKFTLDHYYDKGSYSYLALSLYNLIPSCYACNSKLKGVEEFTNLAPSSYKFNFNKKVKFKLLLSDNCKNLHIKSKDDIEIPLKENYSNEYEKYIEVFKLNERYQAHKDIVFEMMQNAELYPESRLRELQELTGIPYQQIKKDIFNLIDDDVDLSKKPFSKLIKDISEELKLI